MRRFRILTLFAVLLAMLGTATDTPRLGSWRSKPSLVSSLNTSRSVLREICKCSLSAASDSRWPGANSPCTIFWRICSAMRSERLSRVSDGLGMGRSKGRAVVRVYLRRLLQTRAARLALWRGGWWVWQGLAHLCTTWVQQCTLQALR